MGIRRTGARAQLAPLAVPLAALAIVGCGSSHKMTAAQSQACWGKALTAYAPTVNRSDDSAAFVKDMSNAIAAAAVGYAKSGSIPAGDTTPAITAFIKKTQARCGKL